MLNETNFPDEVLRAILKDALKKNDNETITASEIENLTYLDCSDATNRFYSSGTKKYLQNLKGLVDNFTQLQRLNLSKNEKLNNPDLLTGAIYNLISLDVSECKAMSTLNLMTSVSDANTGNNLKLQYLNCSATPIETLSLTKCTELVSLDCSKTKLSTIDLSNNTKLRSLKLDDSGWGASSYTTGTTPKLQTLDVSPCTELRELSCAWNYTAAQTNNRNPLQTLNVSNCTKLETLNCRGSSLKTLDLSKNTALKTLDCSYNLLTALDVSECTALESLNCGINTNLATLTFGNNTELNYVYCETAKLTEIDISGCTKLTKDLVHGDNNLTIHSVPKFHSQALILRSDLGLVFNIEWPNDGMTNYFQSNTSMSFDINNGEASSIFDGANATADKDNAEIFSYECPVNSIQIADPVTAYFAYTKQNIEGDEDAGKTTIITKDYSVQTYLDAVMKDNTYTVQGNTYFRSEELQNLLMAIKDFGHYVQPVLSKTNGWKLGTDHAVINAANEDYSAFVTSAKNALGKYKSIITDTNSGLKVEYTLELESLTRLLVCLIPDDETVTAVNATLDGGTEEALVYDDTEKCYIVEIPEIRPQLMSKDHTIAVTTNKGTMNIKISALSYANAILNPTSGMTPDMGHGITEDEIKNAAAAIYHYCDCTKKYRGKNGYTD